MVGQLADSAAGAAPTGVPVDRKEDLQVEERKLQWESCSDEAKNKQKSKKVATLERMVSQ